MTILPPRWLRRRPAQPPRPRDQTNLAVVLPWALARAGGELAYPVAWVEFLRGCLEGRAVQVTQVRQRAGGDAEAGRRFASLLDALADLPTLELPVALRLAGIADDLRRDARPVAFGGWAGDLGAHFGMSSSCGARGRILSTIVRFMGARRALELGTAYGMSALFLLEALTRGGADGHLTTVEGTQPAFDTARDLLTGRFADQVRCEFGRTNRVLPQLAGELAPVDLLFHDAGHSRRDYINDFTNALPLFAPGAVLLVDDITWDDRRFASAPPRCYAGWRTITRHPRVRRAVELDGAMGLALLD